jgi:hypothetical protein
MTKEEWAAHRKTSEYKDASRNLATDIFGDKAAAEYWPLKKHDGVAEAALIATYWLMEH